MSKLTIFATKAPSGIALDDVFARYRKELLTTYSDAVPTAPALTIGKDKDGSAVDYRAAAYDVVGKTGSTHEELIVGLTGDWMLEVRASYPHAGIVVKDPNDNVNLRNQLFDIQSPYLAFLSAEKSLKNAVAAKPGKN